MYYERFATDKIKKLIEKFPVLSLTGLRQSGKSTLLRTIFPEWEYVSLENLDKREFALNDPNGFIENYPEKVIIDEVQRAPSLLSYLQTHIDNVGKSSMYILSGLNSLLLHESVSQSLAGRSALMTLHPLSISEMSAAGILKTDLNDAVFCGCFPRIYNQGMEPSDFYSSYIGTYVEKDVRLVKNITDLRLFGQFLKLCAGRIGTVLNVTSLSNDTGISRATVQEWLSLLEASYIIYFLRPYSANVGKRLTKSPKLYFCDTGLAAHLLGVRSPSELDGFYMRGNLFENYVVMDLLKSKLFRGMEDTLCYYRDSNGTEVDVVDLQSAGETLLYEIKASSTMNYGWWRNFAALHGTIGSDFFHSAIVYNGEPTGKATQKQGRYIDWRTL